MRKFPQRGTRGRRWAGPRRRLAWLSVWLQGRQRRLRLVADGGLLTEGGDVLVTESGEELRKENDE